MYTFEILSFFQFKVRFLTSLVLNYDKDLERKRHESLVNNEIYSTIVFNHSQKYQKVQKNLTFCFKHVVSPYRLN